jgi:hypothetical protein
VVPTILGGQVRYLPRTVNDRQGGFLTALRGDLKK